MLKLKIRLQSSKYNFKIDRKNDTLKTKIIKRHAEMIYLYKRIIL